MACLNINTSVTQCISILLRGTELKMNHVMSLVEAVNMSGMGAREAVTALEVIFKHQKSSKIVVATQILEHLVKKGNRNFHEAANKESFQKSVLGLLKRVSEG
jgi:hypothetical protein